MNAQLLRIAVVAASALNVVACSPGKQQVHSTAPAYPELKPIKGTSKLPDIATKPDGGVHVERTIPLTPEENIARIRHNIVQPITFGKTAAGIAINTTFTQSLSVLSDPTGSSENQFFYAENISVIWGEKDPQIPEAIIIFDGYEGVFNLPEKFKSPRMGDSFAAYFTEAAPAVAGTALIQELARHFANQPASYDCIKAKDCSISAKGANVDFMLPNGLVRFSNDAEKKLSIVYFTQPPAPKTPALTAPVVFKKSIGGVNIGWTLAQVKALLGEPIKVAQENLYLYDNGNLIIEIEGDKVASLQIQDDYAGKMTLPTELGNVVLGTEMKAHFSETDPKGENLLRSIVRFLENKDASYDCIAEKTCGIQESAEHIQHMFVGGAMVYEKSEAKKLVIVAVSGE